jgi:DNA-directed RNA polymerase specialized sigma24 family protein
LTLMDHTYDEAMAFPTTQWTQLALATLSGDEAGREALARLCEQYRQPISLFIMSKGFSHQETEDVVQEFFYQWVRSRAWKRAVQTRGRFRNYVCGTVMNVISHLRENQQRLKRGGGELPLNLDTLAENGEEVAAELASTSPEFDRLWALSLVENVLRQLGHDHEKRGQQVEFAILRRFLPGSQNLLSLEEAATQLQTTADTLKVRVHRLRDKFREQLRANIATTVSAPHEVDEEMRYLRSLLTEVMTGRNPA